MYCIFLNYLGTLYTVDIYLNIQYQDRTNIIQGVLHNMTCRLLYTVLDIKEFLLKKSFTQTYFTMKSILQKYDYHMICLIRLFGIKQLSKLWKKKF